MMSPEFANVNSIVLVSVNVQSKFEKEKPPSSIPLVPHAESSATESEKNPSALNGPKFIDGEVVSSPGILLTTMSVSRSEMKTPAVILIALSVEEPAPSAVPTNVWEPPGQKLGRALAESTTILSLAGPVVN